MANQDNYAKLAQVEKRLGVKISNDTSLITKEQCNELLEEIDGLINEELDLEDPDVNTTQYVRSLAKIEVDIVAMFVQQMSMFKKANPGEEARAYWETTPDFTRAHLRKLNRIKQKIKRKLGKPAYVFDSLSGDEIIL